MFEDEEEDDDENDDADDDNEEEQYCVFVYVFIFFKNIKLYFHGNGNDLTNSFLLSQLKETAIQYVLLFPHKQLVGKNIYSFS